MFLIVFVCVCVYVIDACTLCKLNEFSTTTLINMFLKYSFFHNFSLNRSFVILMCSSVPLIRTKLNKRNVRAMNYHLSLITPSVGQLQPVEFYFFFFLFFDKTEKSIYNSILAKPGPVRHITTNIYIQNYIDRSTHTCREYIDRLFE